MYDNDMFTTENINSYELYKEMKSAAGNGPIMPLPAWIHRLGEYYYAKDKYPHIDLEDALVLVHRDISKAFEEINGPRPACCGGGEVK